MEHHLKFYFVDEFIGIHLHKFMRESLYILPMKFMVETKF
jgi:hypothetical protein